MSTKTANIWGMGLMGASIGLCLKSKGWEVRGIDPNTENLKTAMEAGAIDAVGLHPKAEISFIATSVGELTNAISEALEETDGIVTDVGSVKAPILKSISDERFVGGHPMAGNEQDGILGARVDLFEGAVWVITPTPKTSDDSYAKVREVVSFMGAEVVTLPAEEHDRLVAVVSHVPHLTAGALMRLAVDQSQEHSVLMRLAAGGFRDMTRIAAGNPNIWLDICEENKEAICEYLETLIGELQNMKDIVKKGDRESLLAELSAARHARISLPVGVVKPEDLIELRVGILDKPGSVAEVATMAGQLNVNIYDLEIAHSPGGTLGTMILVIQSTQEKALRKKLEELGYSASIQQLK